MHVNGGDTSREYTNKKISFVDQCQSSEEIDLFLCESLQEIISYKWNKYARSHHLVGFGFHLIYMFVLVMYVNVVYIGNTAGMKPTNYVEQDKNEELDEVTQKGLNLQRIYTGILTAAVMYPFFYEIVQLSKYGWKGYFRSFWNIIDALYIFASATMCICQSIYSPFDRVPKLLIILVTFLAMGKTFFYMRIISQFSPIVTMLTSVIADLKNFFIFFMILILMFSLQISILGLGNYKVEGTFRDTFHEDINKDWTQIIGYPQEEHKYIGTFLGNIMSVFRAALGDFSVIGASLYLEQFDNCIFWLIFFSILFITNIVFLNFVIAEAANSYSKVSEKLEQYILIEKCKLIDEAENMIPQKIWNHEWFPKYIVVRKSS